MAKKKETKKTTTTHHTTRWRYTDLAAFIALVTSAILLLIGPIMRWIFNATSVGSLVLQILNVTAMVCLLIAVAIPAWYFVRGKRKGWRVFYWIMLAIYILATVFGVTFGIL